MNEAPAATSRSKRLFYAKSQGSVTAIACSADGTRIAVGTGNPTLVMRASGKSRVRGSWRPTAYLLDAKTGAHLVSLRLTTGDEDAVLDATERVSHFEVSAIAFSPDGKMIAIGTSIGRDQVVRCENRGAPSVARRRAGSGRRQANAEPLGVAQAVDGECRGVEFFPPTAPLLAACGQSFADFGAVFHSTRRLGRLATGPGRLKVWEVATASLRHDLAGHSHAFSVAFSSDGSLLASAGQWSSNREDGAGLVVWDPLTGAQVRRIVANANGGVHAVAFSPDSKMLAFGLVNFDKNNRNAATGTLVLTHAGSGIVQWSSSFAGFAQSVAFAPDGKSLAVLCGGESIRFLDSATGDAGHEIRSSTAPPGKWSEFSITPATNTLTVGGVDRYRNGTVETWSIGKAEKTTKSNDN